MSKFLEKLGVHVMTNREALMDELDELDADAFVKLVLDSDSSLPGELLSIKCHECHQQHGGKCPKPDDGDCVMTMAEWLSQPCTRRRLISEVLI